MTPIFIRFSKRLYKSLWNKNKNLRLLMPDFLKVHSITFYIPQNKLVRGKFWSSERKLVLWPPFFIRSLKGYIKVYGIKKLRLLMPDFESKLHNVI